MTTYRCDYPSEPIGGGNPYWCCKYCKLSDPQINGRIEGHREYCEWRKAQEKLQQLMAEKSQAYWQGVIDGYENTELYEAAVTYFKTQV